MHIPPLCNNNIEIITIGGSSLGTHRPCAPPPPQPFGEPHIQTSYIAIREADSKTLSCTWCFFARKWEPGRYTTCQVALNGNLRSVVN